MKFLAPLLLLSLFFALLFTGYFLIEYVAINKKIKEENWELTKDNKDLIELVNTCAEELRGTQTR